MRSIGRSRNAVRVLAATLVPEHCSSGHCGELCRWSHRISSARGQRNCRPMFKVCRVAQSVKARLVVADEWRQADFEPEAARPLSASAQRQPPLYCHRTRCTNCSLQCLRDSDSASFVLSNLIKLRCRSISKIDPVTSRCGHQFSLTNNLSEAKQFLVSNG
jgi:hypothetical protein